MFDRMLLSAVAAAAVGAATPVLAGETANARQEQKLAMCCEEAVKHLREHRVSADALQNKETAKEGKSPRVEDDPFVRNQSWGG